MSVVSLLGVKILNNPAPFDAKYQFEITFECLEPLQKDLEWKLTYVGSATSSEHDQELDSLLVGPIPVGVNKFIFEADSPDLKRIPTSEILGVTVILLSCSYDDREFVRVGYYVNNEYDNDEMNDDPPAKPVIEKVRRNVLAEKPRVTRFSIKWDSEDSAPAEFPPEQPEADVVEDDGAAYGAEEAELEAAEAEAEAVDGVKEDGEDEEMGGAEDTSGPATAKAEAEESDAGSEDLEAESSGSEEEDIEEEEVEGEADEDMEMGDESAHAEAGKEASIQGQHQENSQQTSLPAYSLPQIHQNFPQHSLTACLSSSLNSIFLAIHTLCFSTTSSPAPFSSRRVPTLIFDVSVACSASYLLCMAVSSRWARDNSQERHEWGSQSGLVRRSLTAGGRSVEVWLQVKRVGIFL
ncbi:MAG: hypothetical protein Q9170_004629 [Blastenia crenularia]